MTIPQASQHGNGGAAHPDAPGTRAFPVSIDDQHLVLHEQHPTGAGLLDAVSKRPCAYTLIQLLKHGEKRTIAPNETVDLGAPGADKFITVNRDIVTVTIDNEPYEIQRGGRTVAEILDKVGKTPDGYALLEEKDGPPLPLPSNQVVPIEGCEVFHTQVQSGASS